MATNEKLYIYGFNKNDWKLTELMSIPAKVTSAAFCGKTLFYMNNSKIYFSFHGKSFFLQNYEKKKYILGFIEQQNRLYLFDKNNSIFSININFQLFHKMVLYIAKKEQLPEIPE